MRASILRYASFATAVFLSGAALAEFTASLGIQSTTLQVESDSDFTTPALDQSTATNDTDVSGEAMLGYRMEFNDTYSIDLELFGQLLAAETDVPVIAGDNDFGVPEGEAEMDWVWGLRLRPGYQITESLRFFIDGGIVWGRLDLDYPQSAITLTELENESPMVLYGWRYGLGLEHALTDFLLISVDYAYTEFQSKDIDDITVSTPPGALDNNNANTTSYTPTLHTFGLNLKVLFGGEWF